MSKKDKTSPIDRTDKMTNNGIYTVYWEYGDNYSMTHSPNEKQHKEIPEKIKVMLAQNLLDDLKIPIRLEAGLLEYYRKGAF